MIFDCKGCGTELRNERADVLVGSGSEFFWQECPNCGNIREYSWLRIKQKVEET